MSDPQIRFDAEIRRAAVCLLAGSLLLGLAHVAALPPWEGYDEPGHYSYIQQLADGEGLPDLATARVSADLETWGATAPMRNIGVPPLEHNGGQWTYRSLYNLSAASAARTKVLVHGTPTAPRRYVASTKPNWEAQHPPLYYLTLVPLYWITADWSWGTHLLALRAVSYLFAWAGLVLTVVSCAHAVQMSTANSMPWNWALLGVAMWPLQGTMVLRQCGRCQRKRLSMRPIVS